MRASGASTIRQSVKLKLNVPSEAPLLEEMLWTLDGVESVTYRMNTDEVLEGFEVIGSHVDLGQAVRDLLMAYRLDESAQIMTESTIAEEDWAESWKQYWHVTRLLPHLIIQPSWETFTPEPGDVVLHLDPGSAFGTGTHETTQLMLLVVADLCQNQRHGIPCLLDVGTGSGILAIYASKLGVSSCLGVDNDPLAIHVAQENALLNAVDEKTGFSTQSLVDLTEPYDVILANILAPVLIEMMPEFKRLLVPQGKVVFSGVTRFQYEKMRASIQGQGLKVLQIFQRGDWLALVCTHA